MGFISFVHAAFVAIQIQVVFVNGFDWCSISCDGVPHTLCQYKAGTGECPGSLTDDEKLAILEQHNRLRMGIAVGKGTGQPTASNMRVLSWDNEAAQIAQRWADTCPQGHDKCRTMQNKDSLGQNYAFRSSTAASDRKTNIELMIKSWYDEIKDMNPNDVQSFKSSGGAVTGHYTAMVWAQTHRVGCGFGTTDNGKTYKFEFYLVCNYYPVGNILTLPIYLEGRACSKCPKGSNCSKKWPGLCSADKDDIGGIPSSSSVLTKTSLPILIYCLYIYFV